jgi:hypothetical protein
MSALVLTFDPIEHKYYYGPNGDQMDERLPSVSEIKEPLVDFSMVDRETLARAGRFGSAVHKMCELYLEETLDYGSLDEALLGCLLAFERWLSEVKPFSIETGVLIDIKSRDYDRNADPVQLAAYYELWKENRLELGTAPIIERALPSIRYKYAGTPDILIPPTNGAEDFTDHRVLYLGRDGKYKYTPAYERQAWPVFGHLLGEYRRNITTKQIIHSWRNR